jgi:hypothetical protein
MMVPGVGQNSRETFAKQAIPGINGPFIGRALIVTKFHIRLTALESMAGTTGWNPRPLPATDANSNKSEVYSERRAH